MRNARVPVLGALVAVVLVGCGGGDSTVTGVVKVDDKELEKGTITFTPADGKSKVTGGSIENGHYSVRVPQGKMKVSISAPKVIGKKAVYATPNSPVMPVTAEDLPARYNEKTELEFDVQAGTNSKDWELKR